MWSTPQHITSAAMSTALEQIGETAEVLIRKNGPFWICTIATQAVRDEDDWAAQVMDSDVVTAIFAACAQWKGAPLLGLRRGGKQ